ncbi:MAG: hypothetical protein HYT39_01255 [Candidatus Sungbacteria bacterium]|nr:hypothetical protein [Candidatus Sungbacteria bacterium]
MISSLALLGFGIFVLIYAFFASAIVYHLRAYTLPGWSMGRIGIIIFILLSLILLALAISAFRQVPWDSYMLNGNFFVK